MTARARVAIDLAPIRAGSGGAGGGIWSYGIALVEHIDRLAPDDLQLIVLARTDQALPSDLRTVEVVRVPAGSRERDTVGRLRWTHSRLPALCRRLGVDVLHKLATEAPAWLPRRTRLVVTLQDFMPEFYRETMREGRRRGPGRTLHDTYFGLMARRALSRASVVITGSDAVAAEARQRHPGARARIVTVHHGVDPLEASPRAPADGTLRLLSVGAFHPHKGQHLAVRALERLAAQDPALASRATLTFRGFAGDGGYHETVRAAADASPLRDRIRFLPYEPGATVADRYAGADLLLQLSAYEGFGLPTIEAQALGVPVVCSDIPVFREVLGDAARFVSCDDPDAVAAAVAALAGDDTERAHLAARGLENARRFGWERAARKTIEVYRTAVTSGE